MFEPGFDQLGKYFTGMVAELEASPIDHGFLGATAWSGTDRSSSNSVMNVMYFKDYSYVHNYAHGPFHREAWNWWNREMAHKKHFSIYHELYQVPSGNWESIYANMAPTGLAATMHRVVLENGKGEEWVYPIVDASRGLLKTSTGRMSRSDGKDHEKYNDYNPYTSAEKI